MKKAKNYFVLFLLGIVLFSCNGKSTSPQSSKSNETKSVKDTLVSKEISGEKTEKPLNDIFVESILFQVIKGSFGGFDFYIQPNHYFHFDQPIPLREIEEKVKYLRIKDFATRNAGDNKWITYENPTQDTKISFDNRGVVTQSVFQKDTEMNFQVNYLPGSPRKFESILLNVSGGTLPVTRLDFKYEDNGRLQSIYVYKKSDNESEFRKTGQRNFTYYEHGLAVDGVFYSFSESDPSKLYQLHFPNQLLYTNSIDKDGNQYYITEMQMGSYKLHDTVAIYDKINNTIYANKVHYYPKYQIVKDGSFPRKKVYTKFDYKGNWIRAEDYNNNSSIPYNITEREITYY